MGRITARKHILRVNLGGPVERRDDILAVEEPLEIRVGGKQLSITMRTPGHDFELAAGFLLSEGIVASGADIVSIRYCAGATAEAGNTYNVLDVTLAPGVPEPAADTARNFYLTSSCGLCGKASIDAVRTSSKHLIERGGGQVTASFIAGLPDRLRAGQAAFDRTGGLHAAGLFDCESGELLVLREDVGRHNAVDKVIGWAVTQGRVPLSGAVLMVSARASFELAQKASMAGIPVLAAVSAASSLAVELAEEAGLTLIGFVRGASMVIYAGADRILLPEPAAIA